MMMRFLTVIFVVFAQIGAADGVANTLTDAAVVPIVRAPSSDFQPLGGALNGPVAQPHTGPARIGGYPVSIAWDHIAVGAAILGAMYLFGTSEAAGGSF